MITNDSRVFTINPLAFGMTPVLSIARYLIGMYVAQPVNTRTHARENAFFGLVSMLNQMITQGYLEKSAILILI